MFFSALAQKKNLMRWGEKKHLRKKIFDHIFGKVSKGDKIKKNIGQISRKVNEGDKIKKLLIYLKKNVMRATKKTSIRNIAEKNVFHLLTYLLGKVFYLPKLTIFLSKIGNNPRRALDRKKLNLWRRSSGLH